MGFGNLLSTTDVSASGLAAERLRMEVATRNIANANSTSSPDGGPYRRQQVLFSSALSQAIPENGNGLSSQLGGVTVKGVVGDQTPFPEIFNPGHPDANAEGYVQMSNVKVPMELVDLMTANRAYEANLKSLQIFKQMSENALSLMSTG